MKDENVLIEQLILGKESAFVDLFDDYGVIVYNVALNIMQHKEDAEDLVQEVFAEVVKSIGNFKKESSLKTWLYKITSNKALDTIRKRNRKKRFAFTVSKDANKEMNQIGHFVHPGVQLEQKELAAYLYAALSSLPERQQLAFTLHKIRIHHFAFVAYPPSPCIVKSHWAKLLKQSSGIGLLFNRYGINQLA